MPLHTQVVLDGYEQTYTNGQTGVPLALDENGKLLVAGITSGGGGGGGSVSAEYNDVRPTLTDGETGTLQLNSRGDLAVVEQYAPGYEDNTNGVNWSAEKPLSAATNALSVDASLVAEASSVTKAAPGRVYKLTVTNTGSDGYFQLFNATSVPADSTIPAYCVSAKSGETVNIDFPFGFYFSIGICWANSSTIATKTVGSANFIAHVFYV